MSWTNVKGTTLTTTTIAASTGITQTGGNSIGRARLRGWHAHTSGAIGNFIISAVSAGARGTDLFNIYVANSAAPPNNQFLQAGGVVCSGGIFVTVPTGGVITVFYDD